MRYGGRGERESTWLVARRCLAIIWRLQQGVASKAALLEAVYDLVGPEAYGGQSGKALNKRFDGDKKRLHERLGVEVRYDAGAGGYVLAVVERPLLNLPDEQLRTLAFLADTFEPDSPHGPQVQKLVRLLLSWLAAERRELFDRARGLPPEVDLAVRDSEPTAREVWKKVAEAYEARQQLRFDYLSSRHEKGEPREHVVEPWHVYFSERGHYRLDGYCLFNDGPNGPWHPNRFFSYRLSRIVPGSVEILPRKLAPSRTRKPYNVVYELSPTIARFGVSRRPELVAEPQVGEGEEGWTRVEGQTYDVFHLARNLLYYGAHCRVLGGGALRQEVEGLVKGLAEVYLENVGTSESF